MRILGINFTLRHTVILAGILAFAFGYASFSKVALAAGELNVYNWGDYINPKVLERFEQEYDVKVTLDTYGSNEEMLAKIQAGATGACSAPSQKVENLRKSDPR